MSAKGLFIKGFTEQEVKQIQANAKKLLMEGKTIMSWNDGSTSVSKQFSMPITDILEECAYALTHFERQADDESHASSSISRAPSASPYELHPTTCSSCILRHNLSL